MSARACYGKGVIRVYHQHSSLEATHQMAAMPEILLLSLVNYKYNGPIELTELREGMICQIWPDSVDLL